MKFSDIFEEIHEPRIKLLSSLYNLTKRNEYAYDLLKDFDVRKQFIFKDNMFHPDEKFFEVVNDKLKMNLSHEVIFPFGPFYEKLNMMDIIPRTWNELLDTDLDYKLFKEFTIISDYMISSRISNLDAYHYVWKKLLDDDDFYKFTDIDYDQHDCFFGIIYKNISDERLIEILSKIKDRNNIFDEDLLSKMKELYVSLENFRR